MYTLDFVTLRQAMQAHQRTGMLSADVPSSVMNLRGPCHIEIILEAGSIVLCTLIGSNGGRIQGKEAEHLLAQLGRLRWTFQAQEEINLPPAVSLPPSLPADERFIFPRRTVRGGQEQMLSWTQKQRAIFLLSDGSKSVAKIAELLNMPLPLVKEMVGNFQSSGWLEIVTQEREKHV